MLKLHAKVAGKGEPIILLHGLFGSLENLGGIARLLSKSFEVHSLDLRNHGRSPHHQQMHYASLAADVEHYMNSVNLDKVHILGHSMGGKTGMQLALDFPERVNKLIVADIAPVQYGRHHDDVFQGLQRIDPSQLKSRQQADELIRKDVPEIAVRQFLLKNLVKHGAGSFGWRMNLSAIKDNYIHIIAGQHHERAFAGKVLFIKGGASDYIKPQYKEHTIKLFPKAEIRVIPNTGHWLHAEKPDVFTAICKRFLN